LLYEENISFSRPFHLFQNNRISGDELRESLLAPQKNSVVSAREQTIPTERTPLIGEISANFSG
jgi:hypothetical protein